MDKPKAPRPKRERWQRFMVGINQTFAPGEKAELCSGPLEFAFRFDYAIISDSIAFDDKAPKLLFHHDQLVDKTIPASIVFSVFYDTQRRDFFTKTEFAKGEKFVLGIFENVSDKPLVVKAAAIGEAKVEQ